MTVLTENQLSIYEAAINFQTLFGLHGDVDIKTFEGTNGNGDEIVQKLVSNTISRRDMVGSTGSLNTTSALDYAVHIDLLLHNDGATERNRLMVQITNAVNENLLPVSIFQKDVLNYHEFNVQAYDLFTKFMAFMNDELILTCYICD